MNIITATATCKNCKDYKNCNKTDKLGIVNEPVLFFRHCKYTGVCNICDKFLNPDERFANVHSSCLNQQTKNCVYCKSQHSTLIINFDKTWIWACIDCQQLNKYDRKESSTATVLI
jgi:hypothetical protein